jgi:5-methylcytosine-specific restriction protein A
MAELPKRPCSYPGGCAALVAAGGGRCPVHASAQKEQRQQRDRERGNSASRGYGRRWQRYRQMFLRSHPLCAEHEKQKRYVAAVVVDHIIPHRGDQQLFWNETNHQALCKPCHDAKTAREDGGFGNLSRADVRTTPEGEG